jgi:hypothetical protein
MSGGYGALAGLDDRTVPPPFDAMAAGTLSTMLASYPVTATYLGDHAHDHQLEDPSREAASNRAAVVRAQVSGLARVVPSGPDQVVDVGVLDTALRAELLDLQTIREGEWNPMLHNPGPGIHALISRDFAPADARLESVLGRLREVPAYLAAARARLGELSRIHTETALAQFAGTRELIDTAVPALAAQVSGGRHDCAAPLAAAGRALDVHIDWLRERLPDTYPDSRLGRELFTTKLALTLDTAFDPESLLHQAEADLERVSAAIIAQAGRLAGVTQPDADTVRAVLDRLAADAPTNETVLASGRDALVSATAFVRGRDLVTVYDDTVEVIEMPEIDRGVAVAYCRDPGPLETAPLPTEIAVSPAPGDWDNAQVASFYREYNHHMLHNLMVHEAMPGHALQLMHANRYRAATPVRAVWGSGSFIEGWAVYAEELMADAGYRDDVSPEAAAGLRMQQLKMQLRTIINAILDLRFHCDDLDEAGALRLMTGRGFQERGEADGKWRRLQLSSTQLCTYYVGYREVRDLAADVQAAHPAWTRREVHDALLGQGSPPARRLRTLLLPG